MQHAHDASNRRAPRVRAVAVPHVLATSPEVAMPFAILLLALLVLLL